MTTTDTIRLMAAEKEIADLREELKEAVEHLTPLVGAIEDWCEGRWDLGKPNRLTTEDLRRAREFLKKHEGKDV